MEIMDLSQEGDAWDDETFEKGYHEFDKDGSGKIEKDEFTQFIKKYADL